MTAFVLFIMYIVTTFSLNSVGSKSVAPSVFAVPPQRRFLHSPLLLYISVVCGNYRKFFDFIPLKNFICSVFKVNKRHHVPQYRCVLVLVRLPCCQHFFDLLHKLIAFYPYPVEIAIPIYNSYYKICNFTLEFQIWFTNQ